MKRFRNLIAAAAAAALCISGGAGLTAGALSENAQYILGDFTGDGLVDVRDIILLQKYLLNGQEELQIQVDRVDMADLDRNDVIDIIDLGYLKRIVLGYAVPEWMLPAVPEPTEPEPTEPEPTEPEPSKLLPSVTDQFEMTTQTVGEARMLSVFVEFADVKYAGDVPSAETLNQELYGSGAASEPYESITKYYERASYGNLHITGDCAYYTCAGNMADYMIYDSDGDAVYETLVMEVMRGLDEQIDFADFDANGDGAIDFISFTVPMDNASYEEQQFWWACTSTWYINPFFQVDGKQIAQYIIMDELPYLDQMNRYKSTIVHEMGHSLGLPDYYVYGNGDHSSSSEGLIGNAGYERMDECIGDFCGFSKLMLGWLREDEVQWYTGSGEQSFVLGDASQTGSCLILPVSGGVGDTTSEYFLVEFLSYTGNNSEAQAYTWKNDSGVRIFHVDAELYTDAWFRTYFKYDSFGENYQGPDKWRVLRLANEGESKPLYHTGDTCGFGTVNFAGYDAAGGQTIDTGYTVQIGAMQDGTCTVTVKKD